MSTREPQGFTCAEVVLFGSSRRRKEEEVNQQCSLKRPDPTFVTTSEADGILWCMHSTTFHIQTRVPRRGGRGPTARSAAREGSELLPRRLAQDDGSFRYCTCLARSRFRNGSWYKAV